MVFKRKIVFSLQFPKPLTNIFTHLWLKLKSTIVFLDIFQTFLSIFQFCPKFVGFFFDFFLEIFRDKIFFLNLNFFRQKVTQWNIFHRYCNNNLFISVHRPTSVVPRQNFKNARHAARTPTLPFIEASYRRLKIWTDGFNRRVMFWTFALG